MLHLAGREADGAILNWLSAEDVATSVAEVEKAAEGAPREIVARIFVIVTEDADMARTVGRRMITAYLNVHAYAEFHRWLGRGPALQPMWDAWAAGDRKAALGRHPRRGGRRARRPRLRIGSAARTCSATSTTASRSPPRWSFPSASTWRRPWPGLSPSAG